MNNNPYPYPAIKLNTGAWMPLVGLGTFLAPAGEVGAAVKAALAAGYRHIDCAAVYNNEAEIGQALHEVYAEGKIKREDIFITSKLRAGGLDPTKSEAMLEKTLADLRTTYLDLYLVHLPVPVVVVNDKSSPMRHVGWGLQDVWRAMEKFYDAKKARAIGISNYAVIAVNDLLCYSRIPPAVQQIERHPFLVQQKLVEFCQKNGILVTAYASLGSPGLMAKIKPGSPELLASEPVLSLAKKYGKTPAQILVRWSVDTGVVTIPKSTKPERVKENFHVFDFHLTPEEVQALSKMDLNVRFFDQEWTGVPMFS